MAELVAIEGADGAGKHTTAARLAETLAAAGRATAIIGFPRYGQTVGAIAIGKVLAGEMAVAAPPETAAVLYALDRLESRAVLESAIAANDVVILDRYIASNMAYQAARVPEREARAMMEWILALETGTFALPRPTLSIYLDTPWDLAKAQILKKAERSYTTRTYDEYEADVALQARVRANYEAIVAADLLGPWRTVRASTGGAMRPPESIVEEIIGHLGTATA